MKPPWICKSKIFLQLISEKTYSHVMETMPLLEDLEKMANHPMPFGKYKGVKLIDLPEPYVVWFSQQGFPHGELGRLLSQVYEIKLNGLEYLIKPLQDK